MNMTGLGRKTIERLATEGKVRVYRTKGNHRRYHRDDFNKHNNLNEEQQR